MVADEELGLVIPAYRPNVERLVDYAGELRDQLEPRRLRIEIDEPGGDTASTLRKAGFEVHASEERRGKGAAIAAGFDEMDTPVLAFVDADASTAPGSVEAVVAEVRHGTDVAVGSRRHPEAEIAGRSPHRAVLGLGLVVLARLLFDASLRDYQCGVKALRQDVWAEIGPRMEEGGFAWDLELIVAADRANFGIEEIPVEWDGGAHTSVDALAAIREFSAALVSLSRGRSEHQGG